MLLPHLLRVVQGRMGVHIRGPEEK